MLHQHHPEGDRRPGRHAFQHRHRRHDGVHQPPDAADGPAAGGAGDRSCCCWPRSPRTWPRSCGRRWATRDTLAYEPWPTFDPALTEGRRDRGAGADQRQGAARLTVPAEIDKAELEKAALADERVRQLIEGKQVRKVIVVPGKLVNIVVGG